MLLIDAKLIVKKHLYGPKLGSFFSALMMAIVAADSINLELIEKGFPEIVQVYRDWQINGDSALE